MTFRGKYCDFILPKQGKEKNKQWKIGEANDRWVRAWKTWISICQMPLLAKNIKRPGTMITGHLKYFYLVVDLKSEAFKHFHGSWVL